MANYYSTTLGDYIGNKFQTSFTGSTNTTLTGIQNNDTSLIYVSYSIGTKIANSGYQQNDIDISNDLQPLAGEHLYTSPTNATTNYTFTVPDNVTSICILCVGGTGNFSRSYIGNSSWFGGTTTNPIVSGSTGVICYAGGGSGSGSGGGTGNEFSINSNNVYTILTRPFGGVYYNGGNGAAAGIGAGGGAGGYAGAGGNGSTTGTAGTGGSAAGGSTSRGGGGIGLYGQGASGTTAGAGGSGGSSTTNTNGALYGGGFGSTTTYGGGAGALNYINNFAVTPGQTYTVHVGNGGTVTSGTSGRGGSGAVRIIWGNGRAFPSTSVGLYNQALN